MKRFVHWVGRVFPSIVDQYRAFVHEHVVADDPWDPETVLAALSASLNGRRIAPAAPLPLASKSWVPTIQPESADKEPVA